jgi:hypothetical protein
MRGIKLGDASTNVRGIAVMWKPRFDHIKVADSALWREPRTVIA